MGKNLLLSILFFCVNGCSNLSSFNANEDKFEIPDSYSVSQSDINKKDADIKKWWEQFNDDELLFLIETSQKNNPDLAQTIVNFKNYENILAINKARLKPVYDLNASINENFNKENKSVNVMLKTSWEIDLFDKNKIELQKTKLEIDNARANWYQLKTAIAAETARSYFDYHFCKMSKEILENDFDSRKKQNEITKSNVEAGFEAPSSIFAESATLSEAKKNILETEAECIINMKGLVAITGLPEEELLNHLKKKPNYLNNNLYLFIPINIPARLIEQRPDIYEAKKMIDISLLNIKLEELKNYPTISLSGNISKSISNITELSLDSCNVNIGPLTVYLPILDMGVRKKEKELAVQKYEQSKINFMYKIKNAIKEIEVALINLNMAKEKNLLDDKIIFGYQESYAAALSRYKVGLTNLFEVEDYNRNYLRAVNTSINNKKKNFNAWIDLYKAVGGGFAIQNFEAESLND